MYATEPTDCNILTSSTLTFILEHFMFLRSWNKIISCKLLLDFDISLYFILLFKNWQTTSLKTEYVEINILLAYLYQPQNVLF